MKTEVRTITPRVAKEMLRMNHGNRKLSQSHVRYLSKQMKEGKWMFDGQPIRTTTTGTILDGQHRLNAVVESETSQPFLIVSGVSPETFKVMDTGKTRSAADVFSIEGINQYANCAAATRVILQLKNGTRSNQNADTRVTNSDILDFYLENQDIGRHVTESGKLYDDFGKVLPLSRIAAYRYLMSEKSVTSAEEFWDKLCMGIGLDKNSPIWVLRKKLIEDKYSKTSLSPTGRLALIYKAWNKFRKGEECRFLRWDKEKEKFPELI